MKVIAIKKDGTYVCEVSHAEIEQFMNLYYGNMNKLKEGGELDLTKGYDFYNDTIRALKTTQDFIKDNGKLVKAIMSGIRVMGNAADVDEKAETE
jgi:hypothetical protein